MFNKKIFLIFCMIFLMGISFVSAIPPVLQTTEAGSLEIIAPTWDYYPQNTAMDVYWHLLNTTQFFTNATADCLYHLYSKNLKGEHIMIVEDVRANGNRRDFEVELNASNFSTAGDYCHLIECNTSIQTGAIERCFVVTEGGVEITEARSNLTIGLLFVLIFLLFISLYAVFNVENYIGKFALYWVSHLLLILITFVAWQVGVEGLLGAMALTGIFRILFWVSIVAVLPMVFLSIAWIVYIHTFNEHFQKLLDKGHDTESAFSIANKKSGGGWFNGK